jgi:hypothetical protein
MRRRSFLKGLLAALTMPVVIAKKAISGERIPRRDEMFTFVFGKQQPVIEIPMDHIPIGLGPK